MKVDRKSQNKRQNSSSPLKVVQQTDLIHKEYGYLKAAKEMLKLKRVQMSQL